VLRRLTLLGVAFSAIVLLAAASGSSAARATFEAGDFVGEWTPNGSAPAQVQGQSFTIRPTTETEGRTASGGNSLNYDVYCKSGNAGVGEATYFTLTYTWSGGGTMGGCHSGKTGAHAYFWGPSSVGYFQPQTVKGELTLASHWGPQNGNNVTYLTFTSVPPRVLFATHVKYASVGRKGGKAAELITATGSGALELSSAPANCGTANAFDSVGVLTIGVVKIGGASLVELDKITVKLDPGGEYRPCDSQETLSKIPVTVAKADPAEKDACAVGSPGTLSITDRTANYGGDAVLISVPKCKISENLHASKAPKSSHVTVAVTFDEKGY
jgi:hypothetical protein